MEMTDIETNHHDNSKMDLLQPRDRLKYLLEEFVLPRESEKRQKVYEEIARLLEMTNKQ